MKISSLKKGLHSAKRLHSLNSNPSRINLQRSLQAIHRAVQVFQLQYVSHTNLVLPKARRRIEARTGRHHHRMAIVLELFEHPLAKAVRVVNRQTNERIERTARIRAKYAFHLAQATDQQLPARIILLVHLFEIALRCVPKSPRPILAQA